MKFIIFLVCFSVSFAAYAKDCNIRVAPLRANKAAVQREIPDGNCKLIKKDILAAHDGCDEVLASINSTIKNEKKKYACSVSALGSTRYTINGMPSHSFYRVCYVCKGDKNKTN